VLTASQFQGLLAVQEQQQGQSIRLVFISSCHSFTLGEHVAAAGVDHVVCIRDEDTVLDSSCQLFQKHFFLAISAGRTVWQAFKCGLQVLRSSPNKQFQNDAGKFALLPENAGHSEVLVCARSPRCFSADVQQDAEHMRAEDSPWGALPARVEDFVGREMDMSHLLRALKHNSHQRRCVEVLGRSGIGKAACMVEVGHFVKLRHNIFSEVRWIRKDEDGEGASSCEEGLKQLRSRLVKTPRKRVLLLLENPQLVLWSPVWHLLDHPNVHMVIRGSSDVQSMAKVHDAVTAAGAKPVRFQLGPLDPLAQARLFLSRASRSLYTSEVLGHQEALANDCGSVWHPRKPVDYLVLANSPLLRLHAGSPRSISTAAQELKSALAPNAPWKNGHESMCRKVLVVMPDRSERSEWLENHMRVQEVVQKMLPEERPSRVSVLIEGCRAQPDMALSCFREDASLGLLLMELRVLITV